MTVNICESLILMVMTGICYCMILLTIVEAGQIHLTISGFSTSSACPAFILATQGLKQIGLTNSIKSYDSLSPCSKTILKDHLSIQPNLVQPNRVVRVAPRRCAHQNPRGRQRRGGRAGHGQRHRGAALDGDRGRGEGQVGGPGGAVHPGQPDEAATWEPRGEGCLGTKKNRSD